MCLYKLHLITRPQKLMLKFLLPSLSFEIVFIFFFPYWLLYLCHPIPIKIERDI